MDASAPPGRRPRRGRGLRAQLTLLALATAFPFFVLILIGVSAEIGREPAAQTPPALHDARVLAARLDQHVVEMEGFLGVASLVVAEHFQHHRHSGMAGLPAQLKAVGLPGISAIMILDPDGKTIAASDDDMAQANVADREWFRTAIAYQRGSVSLALVSRFTGQRVVVFGRGVRDAQGRLLGVIAASVLVDHIEEAVSMRNFSPGVLRWLDLGGRLAGHATREEAGVVEAWTRTREAADAGRLAEWHGTIEVDGRSFLVAEAHSNASSWRAVVATPQLQVSDARRELLFQLAALVAAVLISVVIILRTARGLTRPLTHLGEAFARITAGESGVRVRAAGTAELAQLGAGFNHMAAQLEATRREVQSHQARLASYLRSSSDWLWETGADLRITRIDSTRDPEFASRKHLLVGHAPWDIAYEAQEGAWARQREAIERREAFYGFRCWRNAPAGEVHLRVSAEPVYGPDGEFTGYCGVAQDVTQLVQTARALDAERARFAAIVEAMGGGILMVDRDGRYSYANPRACEILGATREQILAATSDAPPWTRLELDGTPVERGGLVQAKVFEHGREQVTDALIIRPDGREVYLRLSGVPLPGPDGETASVLVTLQDTTEAMCAKIALSDTNRELERRVARRTAQLCARIEELDEITFTVSHDLRAPLRAIDGYASILRDAPEGEDAAELLRRISSSARLMGGMVDALLDYANLGKRPLYRRAVVMNAVVEDVVAELRAQGAGERARFEVGELGVCVADLPFVRDLWVQLISNALRFSAARESPVVRIEMIDVRQGRAYRITDDGEGFDMGFSGQLFRVFQTLGRPGGLGMGLAMARRIVECHGGQISAFSSPGSGAAFTFTLGPGEGWVRDVAFEDRVAA
jgi:PAS domain S-box-containing protein